MTIIKVVCSVILVNVLLQLLQISIPHFVNSRLYQFFIQIRQPTKTIINKQTS